LMPASGEFPYFPEPPAPNKASRLAKFHRDINSIYLNNSIFKQVFIPFIFNIFATGNDRYTLLVP
jgi:hypothetical protein